MADVWDRSRSRASARLVLLALADEASDGGEVSAYRRSYSHLAAKCGCSQATVRRAIRDLCDLGELQVVEAGSGRRQASYRITIPDPQPDIEGVQIAHPGCAECTPRGRDHDHPGCAECTPRGRDHDHPIIPFLPVLPRSDPEGPAVPDPADAVARTVWEASDPRPATPFVAVRSIARRLLDAGWDAEQIRRAMLAAPTISTRTVEWQLRRAGRTAKLDTDRGGPSGQVDAL
jgi:hypothetical protein